MDFEIVVVATHHRKALVLDYLTDVPHQISYTPDLELPDGWSPQPIFAHLVGNQTGAYRCFRGHQLALEKTTKDRVLVFEDDAVPNRPDWLDIAQKASSVLDGFEVCSLHGRRHNLKEFNAFPTHGITFYTPRKNNVWVVGSMAYLIHRPAINRLLKMEYDGYPSDLVLAHRFKFAILDPTPFDHGNARSLIDV